MKPYFLKSIDLGAEVVQTDWQADRITQKTVFWSDGRKEPKKQKVGEWFASLEEAKQARIKMIEYNIISLKNKINHLEELKANLESEFLKHE